MPASETPPILRRLLEEPESFSFGQAMRILGLLFGPAYGGIQAFFEHGVTVTPHLSLGFPPSDLVAVRRLEASEVAALPANADAESASAASDPDETLTANDALPRFALTASFLGLYGAASPLPSFYTEELLDDQREDRYVARDFLDILNKTLYRKYHHAHGLSQLAFRSREQHDPQVENIHYSLLGFGHKALRDIHGLSYRDLGLAPLLARHTRSAMGLEAMVRQCLGLEDVEVEQCVERRVDIPEDQRCHLGRANAALGSDALLGSSVRDASGRFRLHLRGLDRARFTALLPGESLRKTLEHAIGLYLSDPLEYEVILHLESEAATPTQLGDPRWQRLGVDTFLLHPEAPTPAACVGVAMADGNSGPVAKP